MQERGQQGGGGSAAVQSSGDVIDAAGSAGGDHRHRHRFHHRTGQIQVIAGLGAVPVHGGQQDFAGPQGHHLAGPGHGI